MLNPRSIATTGIGFGALAAATLGFIVQVVEPPVVVDTPPSTQQGSGSRYDAGQGYVRTEHGWVKLTKVVRVGVDAFDISKVSRSGVRLTHAPLSVRSHDLAIASSSAQSGSTLSIAVKDYVASQQAITVANIDEALQFATATSHSTSIEWLSMDEIVAILEMTDDLV